MCVSGFGTPSVSRTLRRVAQHGRRCTAGRREQKIARSRQRSRGGERSSHGSARRNAHGPPCGAPWVSPAPYSVSGCTVAELFFAAARSGHVAHAAAHRRSSRSTSCWASGRFLVVGCLVAGYEGCYLYVGYVPPKVTSARSHGRRRRWWLSHEMKSLEAR